MKLLKNLEECDRIEYMFESLFDGRFRRRPRKKCFIDLVLKTGGSVKFRANHVYMVGFGTLMKDWAICLCYAAKAADTFFLSV